MQEAEQETTRSIQGTLQRLEEARTVWRQLRQRRHHLLLFSTTEVKRTAPVANELPPCSTANSAAGTCFDEQAPAASGTTTTASIPGTVSLPGSRKFVAYAGQFLQEADNVAAVNESRNTGALAQQPAVARPQAVIVDKV